MAKYNLIEDGFDSNYTLKDEIEEAKIIFKSDHDCYEKIYKNCYERIMEYLEENDPSKIIMMERFGMHDQKDINEFINKYCPFNFYHRIPFISTWYMLSFNGKNKDGEKYIWSYSDGLATIIFTEDFLNKYIDTKGE